MLQEITDEQDKALRYYAKRFVRFVVIENYMKSLSTRKLIKVAEKILSPTIEILGAREAVYEEMITRLGDKAKSEEMVTRIINENRGKF